MEKTGENNNIEAAKEDAKEEAKITKNCANAIIKKSDYEQLPLLEVIFYIFIWLSMYGYMMKNVYDSSTASFRDALKRRDIEVKKDFFTSWPYADTSDYEWEMWNYWTRWYMAVNFIYFVVMRITEVLAEKYRFRVSMFFSVVLIIVMFGSKGLWILLSQTFAVFSIAYFTESVKMTWLCAVATIVPLTRREVITILVNVFDNQEVFYLFIVICTLCNLRYIAFSLEYCWYKNELKEDKTETQAKSLKSFVFDLLEFEFYFPLLLGGPITTYRDFKRQKSKPKAAWGKSFLFYFTLNVCRYAVWHLFLNWALHFMYIPAMHNDLDLLDSVPLFTLLGMAISYDQYFCVKYMVLYGVPSALAVADNVIVDGAPHCVSGKFKFLDMWKYFDKGLHKWLLRYIYIPTGGSAFHLSFPRKTINAVLPFVFVYLWHGLYYHHLIWATINAFGVYIEMICRDLSKTNSVATFENTFLSKGWTRRYRALLAMFTFSLLIISNLYFLAGVDAGNLYMKRIYTEDFLTTALLHLLLYCGIQTSMEVSRRISK